MKIILAILFFAPAIWILLSKRLFGPRHSAKNVTIPEIVDKDRIYFTAGNPWPEGHVIKTCFLDARLYQEGILQITIHLETLDYRENDGGEFIGNNKTNDWESKDVWNNYHSCNIDGIILSSDGKSQISIDGLNQSNHHIDPLPEAYQSFLEDEMAFHVYLLGHDSVADHRISLGELTTEGYPMKWTGKIALSYSGEEQFDYAFAIETTLKPLQQISYPEEWSDSKAKEMLARFLVEHERFEPNKVDGRNTFVLK